MSFPDQDDDSSTIPGSSLKKAHRPCPVCANTQVEVLHHQKFTLSAGHILPDAYDVVWCPACGFAYADTPASQQDYDAYYADFSKYQDDKTSTGGGGAEWDARRLQETARAIAEVVPDRQARILDVGCANGGLLGELKALDYTHLVGVDPSPACVANAGRNFDVEAVTGWLGRLPENMGKFDVVMLAHVLEHVADVTSAVGELSQLLKENGTLYVEVPDASRYADYLIAPFQDFNTEHINHFGLFSLRSLFGSHGFTEVSSGQKEIESSPGCPYPVAYAFFRRSNAASGPVMSEKQSFPIDSVFQKSLLRYISLSRAKLQQIEQLLAPHVGEEKPLIVWGTGQLSMKLLAETSLGRAAIAAFVDGNPINQGKKIAGVPVVAPEQISGMNHPILIATLLHHQAITARIRDDLRLTNPIIMLASPEANGGSDNAVV